MAMGIQAIETLFRRPMVRLVFVLCWSMGWFPSLLDACQICYGIPKVSAADDLISAERVVLAREDPGRPFHLKAVEVLKGDGTVPEIDLRGVC